MSDSAYTTPAHRSRLWAGGTFFRSISQNQYVNGLSISVTANTSSVPLYGNEYNVNTNTFMTSSGSIPIGTFTLSVAYSGVVQEIYTATQSVSGGYVEGPDGEVVSGINITSAIPTFRNLINGINYPGSLNYNVFTQLVPNVNTQTNPSSGSSFISMPPRGYDVFDQGQSDAYFLTPFELTFMSGGAGPTDNLQYIDSIPSGIYKILILETIENPDGSPDTVIPYQFKTFMWSPYSLSWSSIAGTEY